VEGILIEHLDMIAKEITEEVEEKREWGHFGNSFGRSECRKKLEFWSEVLMAIAVNI